VYIWCEKSSLPSLDWPSAGDMIEISTEEDQRLANITSMALSWLKDEYIVDKRDCLRYAISTCIEKNENLLPYHC
jgi:hypothetical protein